MSDFQGVKTLQAMAPWTSLWSEEYTKDPRGYKDFEHCLVNIVAKAAELLAMCEKADHYGGNDKFDERTIKRNLGFIVMSALKAANKNPVGPPIEVSEFIEDDYHRRGVL